LRGSAVQGGAHEDSTPAKTHRYWKRARWDLGEILFLPALAAALRAQAPHGHLSNISVAAADVATALEARDIDCAIGILQPRQRNIHSELLFREQYVALTSAHWRPASGRAGASLRGRLGAGSAAAQPDGHMWVVVWGERETAL